MTQTFVPQAEEQREAQRAALLARAEALGWTQNEWARRAKKNPGHVSLVLRGLVVAAPTWRALIRALDVAERRRGQGAAAS
jgi:ParB-like chromosome segregation protein Spo0J